MAVSDPECEKDILVIVIENNLTNTVRGAPGGITNEFFFILALINGSFSLFAYFIAVFVIFEDKKSVT